MSLPKTTMHRIEGHCERCGGRTPLMCGDCHFAGVVVFVCSATACRNAHEAEAGCIQATQARMATAYGTKP